MRNGDLTRPPPGGDPTDISQIAFKSMAIILKLCRRRNDFLSAAIRQPDFGALAVIVCLQSHCIGHGTR